MENLVDLAFTIKEKITDQEYLQLMDGLQTINNNKGRTDWDLISSARGLPELFIDTFQDNVNWEIISACQKLSEPFISAFRNKVDWDAISRYQKLSESFIREFKDRVDWSCIAHVHVLSESFIREFQDRLDWYSLSYKQVLSESFIREFHDRVNWVMISKYQILSDSFITEFQDRIVSPYTTIDCEYYDEEQRLHKFLIFWKSIVIRDIRVVGINVNDIERIEVFSGSLFLDFYESYNPIDDDSQEFQLKSILPMFDTEQFTLNMQPLSINIQLKSPENGSPLLKVAFRNTNDDPDTVILHCNRYGYLIPNVKTSIIPPEMFEDVISMKIEKGNETTRAPFRLHCIVSKQFNLKTGQVLIAS